MSFPTVQGRAIEGSPLHTPQVCLGPAFANATYKFFLSGTSTPANVYQNGTLTTAYPNTGVVSADNFGRFRPIYLDPSVIYKVQFFDSGNNLKWTRDPYYSQLSTVGTSSLSAFGVNIAPTGEITMPAPNSGGTGNTLTLKAGALGTAALELNGTLGGNSAIIVNNSATTGAQTATFTASNKPGTATSGPAGWLPITCDGVQYYTPIWHGNPFSPYVPNPSAVGEVINASSVLFTGSGLTTATGGTATPSNWFTPTAANIGAGYYINITKTGGLSGLAFSAAQGAWTNITAGGLTISSNAQSQITGTYQLSSSVTGSPVVASGTITLANNNGIQSPTYNGATPIILAGNGTATLNGAGTSNWFAPTTANVGASYWINLTQTGNTNGANFNAAVGAWTNITNGGLTIGLSGGSGATFSASGTYLIASDSGGVNQLGSGNITLTGSSVQSNNYSGNTPLFLAGDGETQLNHAFTTSWYSPNVANTGSGYWINVTRTGGTSGVNFSAAQGSWTNITNSGLTIDITGYAGVDVGTATASGTYQISNSSSGTPVLGSGTISLSITGLTITHTYNSGTSATETVPPGSSFLTIKVWGGGGSGSTINSTFGTLTGGGGGGGYSVSTAIAVTPGQTFTYTVGAGGPGTAGGAASPGNPGGASTVTGTGVSITANGGGAGANGPSNGAGGTASGGNTTNNTGSAGNTTTGGNNGNGTGGGAPGGGTPGGGSGGEPNNTATNPGGNGQVQFIYT